MKLTRLKAIAIAALALLLAACASKQSVEVANQTRQDIDDALAAAAAVEIPEVEAPSDEILDELLPGSGISVPRNMVYGFE